MDNIEILLRRRMRKRMLVRPPTVIVSEPFSLFSRESSLPQYNCVDGNGGGSLVAKSTPGPNTDDYFRRHMTSDSAQYKPRIWTRRSPLVLLFSQPKLYVFLRNQSQLDKYPACVHCVLRGKPMLRKREKSKRFSGVANAWERRRGKEAGWGSKELRPQ